MIMAVCMLLPPFLFVTLRNYLKNDRRLQIKFDSTLLTEYLAALLLLTLTCLGILVFVFHHTGELTDAFKHYSDFTLHYLLMATTVAGGGALAEYIIRTKVRICIDFSGLKNMRWNAAAVLTVYAAVLIAMNFIRCFDNSFWGDEGYSIKLSRMTFGGMISATASDVHPPLYYIFLWTACKAFGESGFLFHFISLIPYLGIILLGITYVRKHFGNIPCMLLLTLSSLTGSARGYNVEVRMYSWAALFVFASFLCLQRILRANKRTAWMLFVLTSLAAAYTHYYALIMVAFFYAGMILLSMKQKKYRLGTVIACAAAVIGYLPWLGILWKSFERTSSRWWLTSVPTWKNLFLFVFDDIRMLPILLIVLLMYGLYESKIFTIEKEEPGWHISLLAAKFSITSEMIWIFFGLLAAIGTPAVGLLLSKLIRPLFVVRYLFPATSLMYLIMGVALSKCKLRKIWAILLCAFVLSFEIPAYWETYQSEKTLDQATINFTETVLLDDESVAYINEGLSHLRWTIFAYYYPDTEIVSVSAESLQEVEAATESILIWSEPLDEEMLELLSKKNSIEKIHEGKLGTSTALYVYRIAPLEE